MIYEYARLKEAGKKQKKNNKNDIQCRHYEFVGISQWCESKINKISREHIYRKIKIFDSNLNLEFIKIYYSPHAKTEHSLHQTQR